jgi:hypothetical protein
MPEGYAPALTAEQWEARDYRQAARELDTWARDTAGREKDDSTEYVAKLGLDSDGVVVMMNRAHDRVVVPPPARAALAAFALADQLFGFSRADVSALRRAADAGLDNGTAKALGGIADRLQALLPPAGR